MTREYYLPLTAALTEVPGAAVPNRLVRHLEIFFERLFEASGLLVTDGLGRVEGVGRGSRGIDGVRALLDLILVLCACRIPGARYPQRLASER